MGDFGAPSPENARPVLIDRDDFGQILERICGPTEVPGAGIFQPKELDDFHPDRLYSSLRIFQGLRDMRTRLEDPGSFSSTANALMNALHPGPRPDAQHLLSSGNLLDQVVEQAGSAGQAARPARSADPFQQYLESIVAPYVVPKPDPKQTEMLGQLDNATAAQMRALLHSPRFQSLEAAWRALYFLVHHADTGAVKIYVWNISKEALASDVLPATDLRATTLFRVLVQDTIATPGAQPWAMVLGNYSFGPDARDVELLGRFALLASAAASPLIAHAGSEVLGDGRELSVWQELRKVPESRYIGLALPRFLLRLPYGKETSAVEAFPFEEVQGEPRHGEYLWGNPAFLCASLIAEAFTETGWDMQPGDALDISGLPAHVYKKNGDAVMTPCAEVLMTIDEAEALMERGLIPLVSIKDTGRIHVAGFRSITGQPLAGRWQ